MNDLYNDLFKVCVKHVVNLTLITWWVIKFNFLLKTIFFTYETDMNTNYISIFLKAFVFFIIGTHLSKYY